eukprot:gene8735-8547_t
MVFVVDDDAPLRESLGSLLRSIGLRVELFGSVADFMKYPRPDTASCLVLDVRLQGSSGLDFQNELAAAGINVPIVFITGYGDIAMTVRAMKAGAVDFLTKPFREQDLIDAVCAAHSRDRQRRESERHAEQLRARHQTLTAREQTVMALAASGLMNKQIAGEIGLSEITVKIHRGQAMRKMGARSFADLVRMAEVAIHIPVIFITGNPGAQRPPGNHARIPIAFFPKPFSTEKLLACIEAQILIIGAGFGGVWSALSAARLLDKHDRNDVEITVLAPQAELRIRPRFYEPDVHTMKAPLDELFDAVGVKFVKGSAEVIDESSRQVSYVNAAGIQGKLGYDRLVLAAGSKLMRPPVDGLEHAFDVDEIESATRLEAHIKSLKDKPVSAARNTVVVAGGGFTGIETATEMPARLRAVLGEDADIRVVVVDRAAQIGAALGDGIRPTIVEASEHL